MGWLTAIMTGLKFVEKIWDKIDNPWRKAKKIEKEYQETKKKLKELAHGDDEKELKDYIDSLPY